MNTYIIGNQEAGEHHWVEATKDEMNRMLHRKLIEEIKEIDKNTFAIHLTNKVLYIKKQEKNWLINLMNKT